MGMITKFIYKETSEIRTAKNLKEKSNNILKDINANFPRQDIDRQVV